MKTSLSELESQCNDCSLCGLANGANARVFGEGNAANPEVLFIGEGPGEFEDRTGRPFVGPAGKLLRNTISDKLLTGVVYVTNIVKCRPPENREPTEEEVKACFPLLARQVKAIDPMCIVTLGNPATRALLGPDMPGITKCYGELHYTKGGRPVVPLLHPAAPLHQERFMPMYEEGFDKLIEHLLVLSGCPY